MINYYICVGYSCVGLSLCLVKRLGIGFGKVFCLSGVEKSLRIVCGLES